MMAASASLVNICKFGEQVHYKLSARPASRVEPRWELGACVVKMELTDERLLGTLTGISGSRTIYRLTKSHCYNKDTLGRIVCSNDTQARRVRPGIHKLGDSTSHRDGLTNMVSLLVVFAVKAEERFPTLKSAGRGSKQQRRRNLTNSWRRPPGMRHRHR